MKFQITWVECGTNNAACIGLDETVECESLDQAESDAIYHAKCDGIDLERYECVVEEVGDDSEEADPDAIPEGMERVSLVRDDATDVVLYQVESSDDSFYLCDADGDRVGCGSWTLLKVLGTVTADDSDAFFELIERTADRIETEEVTTTAYKLAMRDDGGSRETVEIEADDLDEAREQAESEVRDWVRGGEWGDEGAAVRVYWTILDEDDDEIYEDATVVDVEPDHDALIRAAGGDPDCDHEWTSEGEGGCTENPGVWSLGGTTISVSDHCRLCGLHRCKVYLGSQRNPGEHDTVEYVQPESWCADCESEECRCED